MMPIKEPNNDQNIDRGYTKMSEDCPTQNNNAKLTDCIENINYLNNLSNSDNKDELNLSYDHMYASNTDNVELNPADTNCQNTESEVKFLKEWLLMHLDLIQQQNDEILNKEKTILILKQENEMLKEHINRLDRGITFQTNTHNNYTSRNYSCDEVLEEMTQDAAHIDEDNKPPVYFLEPHNSSMNNCAESPNFDISHELNIHDKEVTSENCSQLQNTSNNCDTDSLPTVKKETSTSTTENNTTSNKPLSPKSTPVNDSTNNSIVKFNNSNFVVNSSVEDTLKNLRMSIRRKRLCSSSSALSNNDTSIEEPRSSRKKRKRKGSLKDEKILTFNEQYVTQTGEVVALGLPVESDPTAEIPCAANLEVPRWRVKVYTSCYTMEGTENLDDEVYNKRHMRLENDERRRKRWDVQRIREQRIIEKLKQRQERIGSGSRMDDQSDSFQTLWPTLEDIKYLEVSDQLPVSAFGAPIPRLNPSEFSLPWLNNPHASLKKTSNRKSTIRRKATKR